MSNFMEFLEKMGQDAQLRYATSHELQQALTRAQIDPAVGAAVLTGDRRQLEVLLGATANTFCGVIAPAGDEGRASNDATAARQAAVA